MTDIIIGNSVEWFGRYAFSDCTGLTSILIPASVKGLNYEVFHKCKNLTNIKVAEGNYADKVRIGWNYRIKGNKIAYGSTKCKIRGPYAY